jgi:hypothetical protein
MSNILGSFSMCDILPCTNSPECKPKRCTILCEKLKKKRYVENIILKDHDLACIILA